MTPHHTQIAEANGTLPLEVSEALSDLKRSYLTNAGTGTPDKSKLYVVGNDTLSIDRKRRLPIPRRFIPYFQDGVYCSPNPSGGLLLFSGEAFALLQLRLMNGEDDQTPSKQKAALGTFLETNSRSSNLDGANRILLTKDMLQAGGFNSDVIENKGGKAILAPHLCYFELLPFERPNP